ncbi:MAG: hypothetical protein AAGB51_13445 [Planctomycetota bacterium]
MDNLYDAHPITLIVVTAAILVTPIYLFWALTFSGKPTAAAIRLSVAWLVLGALMTWVCLAGVPDGLGAPGQLVVPTLWFVPSLLLVLTPAGRTLAAGLDQRWLVGLQIWRVIGGVFLIEMARGNLAGAFAYPAGIGDVLVGIVALGVLVRYRKAERIPRGAILVVAALGLADFATAFFFGFTTAPEPIQLFGADAPHHVTQYPTGLIPFLLVPYAIFFHTLSLLALRAERPAPGSAEVAERAVQG